MFYNICPVCGTLSASHQMAPASWWEVETPAGHSLDCDAELKDLEFSKDDGNKADTLVALRGLFVPSVVNPADCDFATGKGSADADWVMASLR